MLTLLLVLLILAAIFGAVRVGDLLWVAVVVLVVVLVFRLAG